MTPDRYPVAERFIAPQGEGLFSGTTMAFIRLVGCSVGQKICTACDTDFDTMRPDLGGGLFTPDNLANWVAHSNVQHVCLTGGEPLDRDLRPLLLRLTNSGTMCHVETSGTKHPEWLDPVPQPKRGNAQHAVGIAYENRLAWRWMPLWVTVSPKPGYRTEMITEVADEVKVILGGLGDGPGWPTLEDALLWRNEGQELIYVQPRNNRLDINGSNMKEAIQVVTDHPSLRLSTQLHKWLRTR